MSAYPVPFSSRVSGGVVVLSPNEPPNGWDNVEAFMADVQSAKRLADAAPEYHAATDELLYAYAELAPEMLDRANVDKRWERLAKAIVALDAVARKAVGR